MKVISCASYHGTGSSAITDFLGEFDNVCSMTNYEFRFVQDPDGISDLEYNQYRKLLLYMQLTNLHLQCP